MGGVLGVVFPDGGGFYVEAGGVQLQNGGQLLVSHVLQEGVGGQVGDTAQVKLVPEADDGPGIFVGPGIGNFCSGSNTDCSHYDCSMAVCGTDRWLCPGKGDFRSCYQLPLCTGTGNTGGHYGWKWRGSKKRNFV